MRGQTAALEIAGSWDNAACLDRGLSVLVVDDDEAARSALADAVCAMGHTCHTAADGLEAWNRHRESPAELILCEWNVPELTGLQLCHRVRSWSPAAYTHFILFTALDQKARFLEGMRAGADDCLHRPIDLEVLEARLLAASRVCAVQRELLGRARSLETDSQRLVVIARTDPLTEAANRRRLKEDLEAIVDRAKRYGHRYCAGFCDIDWFKSYNDEFGHLAGDDAIRLVSYAIQRQLRRGDGFYRYGGEEFLVLLPEQSLSGATECMERVRRAVATVHETPEGNGLARPLTISVGVAELRPVESTDPIRAWLQRADSAVYRAKQLGRNRVEVDT